MLRRFLSVLAVATAITPSPTALAHSEGIEVVVVNGPMDGRLIDFVIGAVEGSDASLVVLQLDVPAVLDLHVVDLLALLADPPVPVAVWVGPAPAVAHGAAALLVASAPLRGAAPGAKIGWATPLLAGGSADPDRIAELAPELPEEAYSGRIRVDEEPVPGLIDVVQPAIGQFIVALDGTVVSVQGQEVTLATAVRDVEDGVPVVRPVAGVRFIEPGLLDRTLGVALGPEAAFFFLVVGLSLAAFEFYAVGPGVAAALAVLFLLLAGYGMAVLPVWWPAVGAVLVAVILFLVELQRNTLGWRTVLGTVVLGFGGLRFVDAAPQLVSSWWVVVLVVVGTVLFFGLALTTVVRARFSTQTIGRGHLVGRTGTALGSIAPDGLVVVDGAEWRARSRRASGIAEGDQVVVTAVQGVTLEVAPVDDV